MNMLYFAIPIALLLGIFFLILFVFAVRSGQFDDLDGPSYKILFEDKLDNQKQKDRS